MTLLPLPFFRGLYFFRALVTMLLGTVLLAGCGTRDEWAHRALGLDRTLSSVHEVTINTQAGPIPTLTGGTGEPLVLIHGFAGDKDNWTRVARALNDRYTIWAPDLLAFGDAPKDNGADYLIHAQAERVVAWADAAHLSRFHLGGNSMGGFIAADIAANHPDRVLSLWLIDPAGVRGAKPGLVEKAYRENGSMIMVVDSNAGFRRMLGMVFNDDLPALIPGFVIDSMADQAIRDRALRSKVFRDLVNQDQPQLNDLLPKVKAPTLLVWGDHDQVLDPSGVEILKAIKTDMAVVVMPATGHSPMVDKPKPVAADFLHWQDSLKPAHPAGA